MKIPGISIKIDNSCNWCCKCRPAKRAGPGTLVYITADGSAVRRNVTRNHADIHQSIANLRATLLQISNEMDADHQDLITTLEERTQISIGTQTPRELNLGTIERINEALSIYFQQ